MKQYKSMIFVLVMMIAVLIVSTAAVDAQSASIPAYTITRDRKSTRLNSSHGS